MNTLGPIVSYKNKNNPTITAGKVNVLSHPLVETRLRIIKQISTSSREYREAVHEISLILGIEATRNLEEGTSNGVPTCHRIGLAPILRAGLGMNDALLTLFPEASVYHLGLFRDEVTMQPVKYYSKLPPSPQVDSVFLLDPILATGGTAIAALNMIADSGIPPTKIKLLCVYASEEGLKAVHSSFPDVEIWVAGVDPTMKARSSSGRGDAGDRLFSTVATAKL